MTNKNYYELLEISSDATTMEIKTAYHKMVRKYHPDVNKAPDAAECFKEIAVAYKVLSDFEKRKQYNIINGIFEPPKTVKTDTTITNNEQTTATKNETTAKSTQKETHKQKPTKNKNWFTLFLTKLKKHRKERFFKKPQKGEDISTTIEVSPDEIINGSKRVINILTKKTCEKCYGHKFINDGICDNCHGTGIVSKNKRITVTIPKGVKDGAKLRLKGEGASGKNGGANGDVYITIKLETKNQVHFDKLNIYYNVPITPFEAALGEEIKIPTFDGIVKIKLPQNTCSGQKFRIANHGIKKNGKIGDLIITVSIEISDSLSDDEIKLYEKLKNLSHNDIRKNIINE